MVPMKRDPTMVKKVGETQKVNGYVISASTKILNSMTKKTFLWAY